MNYDIFIHGGSNIIIIALNAVAMIVNSNYWVDILKLIFVIGFFIIAVKSAFQLSNIKEKAIWVGSVFLIIHVLFGITTKVTIYDKSSPSFVRTIDNIPIGLAIPQSYLSKIGQKLSEVFDQANSLPDDQIYNKYGFLFGANLMANSAKLSIINTHLIYNIRDFNKQCITYDVDVAEKYSWQELQSSKDPWTLVTSTHTASKVKFFTYRQGKERINISCFEGVSLLNNDWEKEVNYQLRNIWNKTAREKIVDEVSDIAIKNHYEATSSYFLSSSQTSLEQIKNILFINSLNKDLDTMGTNSDVVAQLKTMQSYERKQSSAAIWIPVFLSVFNALLIGVFPLIALFALLPGGWKLFSNYMTSLIWLQTMPIIYSILHSFLTTSYKEQIGLLGGISMQNINEFYDIDSNIAAMAGNLMMLVPFISLAIITRISSLAHSSGAIMATPAANAESAAEEISTGNYRYGTSYTDDHNFNNVSANKHDTSILNRSYGTTMQNDMGQEVTTYGNGNFRIDSSGQVHNLPFNIDLNGSMSSAMSQKASSLEETGNSLTHQSTEHLANSMNNVMQLSERLSKSEEYGESWMNQQSSEVREAFDTLENYTHRLSGGVDASDSVIGKIVGIKGGYEFSKEDQEELHNAISVVNQATSEGRLNISDQKGQELLEDVRNDYISYQEKGKSAENYYRQSDILENEVSNIKENSVSYRKELGNHFINWAEKPIEEGGAGISRESILNELANPNQDAVMPYVDKFSQQYAEKYIEKLIPDNLGNKQQENLDNYHQNNPDIINQSSEIENMAKEQNLSLDNKINDSLKNNVDKQINENQKEIKKEHNKNLKEVRDNTEMSKNKIRLKDDMVD